MNDKNNHLNFYSDNENLNPNPDFKNLLKISKTDVLKKEQNANNITNVLNYKKSNILNKKKFCFTI